MWTSEMFGLPNGDDVSYVITPEDYMDRHNLVAALDTFTTEKKFQKDIDSMFVGSLGKIHWMSVLDIQKTIVGKILKEEARKCLAKKKSKTS